MVKQKNNPFPIIALVLLLIVSAVMLNQPNSQVEALKTSEVIDMFRTQQVTEYELNIGNGNLTLKVKGEEEEITYKLPDVGSFVNKIDPYVDEYNKANPNNPMVYNWITPMAFPSWVGSLLYGVMIIGLGVFMFMMFKQASGGAKGMGVGRVKTKDLNTTTDKKTFADVAGADEEKEELVEIVDFLKNPTKYNALGAKIPKGVLLVGPPGTGKTLLAKATAGEAGVPFFSLSGSDFVEMYVGVGASRVRDLFEKAKKSAPCIVFIDEIDAVGRQRGTGMGGGNDEREQTLNQLLVEMDGFGADESVIIIAATNRADVLDRALLRPGRFDRQIYVGAPDVKGRQEVLQVHFKGKPIGPDIDLNAIARATAGFTGADLGNLINEAALLAAKKGKKAITQKEVEEATIKVIAGPEKKSRVIIPQEKKLVSYHEAGHALATYYCKTSPPVQEISIIPRGMAGGYTLSLPENDTNFRTKTQMLDEIVVLLGGRIAEQLILDDISTGASNDLERVTSIAKAMVTRYGFSEKLGNVVYGQDNDQPFLGRDYTQGRSYSESIANEIDNEVRNIVDTCYERCKNILLENMEQLHLVAKDLMELEKVDAARFAALMSGDFEPVEEIVKRQAEIAKQKAKELQEQQEREQLAQIEKEKQLMQQAQLNATITAPVQEDVVENIENNEVELLDNSEEETSDKE